MPAVSRQITCIRSLQIRSSTAVMRVDEHSVKAFKSCKSGKVFSHDSNCSNLAESQAGSEYVQDYRLAVQKWSPNPTSSFRPKKGIFR